MAKFMQMKWSDAKEIKRAGIGRGPCIAHDEYALTGALDFIESYFNSPYYDRPRAPQPLTAQGQLSPAPLPLLHG